MLTGPGHMILPDALLPELRNWSRPKSEGPGPPATADLDALIADALANGPGEAYERVRAGGRDAAVCGGAGPDDGNQAQASELLGLHRATLRHRLRNSGWRSRRRSRSPARTKHESPSV